MQKNNTSEIRRYNKSTIFRYLYHHPNITKQELAVSSGLSMPTVSLNLAELKEENLITTSGMRDSTGGRRAMQLSVNAAAHYAVGVNITAHHLACVLLDLNMQLIYHKRIRLPFVNSQEYMKTLADFIWEPILTNQIPKENILGVGLSVPAIIAQDGQALTYASVLNFTDGRLEDFAKPIGLPCCFVNDSSAGGFAALCYGTRGQEQTNSVAYLSLSNSVGGAFFSNGIEYKGSNQRSCEFGHMTLHPDGETCYCGKRGCADVYLRATRLSDPYDGRLDAFFSDLEAGAPLARSLWASYRDDLVMCANNIHMVYDCDLVLGGYVGEYLTPYCEELQSLVAARNSFTNDGSYLSIVKTFPESSAVGAALIWISNFIQSI